MREDDTEEVCEWSCSSCYLYALCGRVPDAPPLPKPATPGMVELREALKKLAKQLAKTQQCSKVP